MPLQSCLLIALLSDEVLVPELSEVLHPVVAIVPATKPAIAAEMTIVLAVRVIMLFRLFVFIVCSTKERALDQGLGTSARSVLSEVRHRTLMSVSRNASVV